MSKVKSKGSAAKKVKAEVIANEEKTYITPEQRYQMIAEAAYFRAEKRDLIGGDVAHDWLEAEVEIDHILQR
ncbi:MAG: DUF2934 domain-containing protein [Pseudomonadota bacterium]